MELLRDRSEELQDAGVRPFGVSRDFRGRTSRGCRRSTRRCRSSPTGTPTRRGVRLARSYHGMDDVPVRSAFLVDQGGTVRRAWRYDDAEVLDLDAIVAAARAL